ncbi:Cathepsin L [Oopsacas minuta]|uniref:Cathepsin L n=1 Tax=Oopsacas minuta TaxID=111878 RepID=A0AAV7KH63_9METZ|nr:Cathepsin L [Oopsacas minuta]
MANAFSFNVNIALDVNVVDVWAEWKQTHEKEYDTIVEEEIRKAIWMDNLVYIQTFNSEEHSYKLGLNQFSDYTNKEFQEIFLGYDYEQSLVRRNATLHKVDSSVEIADSMDWRGKGAVTGVKDQGQCGSCWSFSATGSLEGQYFLKTGKLISFSEQQLCDCSTGYGNHGCKGGLMDNAFRYWEKYYEESEDNYPYRAKDGMCQYDESKGITEDSTYRDIPRGSEQGLMDAIAKVGPISVAMDAGHRSFQSYHSGVYSERACSSFKLDHGVLAVGYDSTGGYWIIKNSWGTRWGMEGYFEIAMADNMCGICTQASYPII